MLFRIADTFTDSLARLTGDEQKAVKTTAFDLQLNPANPGMSFHKLDKAKDKNFWSVRVSRDLRLIVHRMPTSLMLCYVDHHDKAYAWAERRKLEVHPTTGAAQFVEIRERIEEIAIPVYVAKETAAPKAQLFVRYTDDVLLGFGVPAEWLAEVRAATEDTLIDVAEHLPQEAAEALLDIATGIEPRRRVAPQPEADPFEHPDAQRRFRAIEGAEELQRALDYPWDKWTIFLHPSQRDVVERSFNGPARVSGSAGTGKTIVALHRAVHLAKSALDARVLLTTFSEPLANALHGKLRRLISNEPRLGERIEVHGLDTIARRLFERVIGRARFIELDEIARLIEAARSEHPEAKAFSTAFMTAEWRDVVDAWQIGTWEAYKDIPRLGRKTRLPEKQRRALWSVFENVLATCRERGLITPAFALTQLAQHFSHQVSRPFDVVVVDESQDLSVPQLRFLAAFGSERANGLFFAGDLGQRIFQPAFSWRQLGVDIRGRSSTLRVNYRTSQQIRARADRLLDEKLTDVDGNDEKRAAISVLNGTPPRIETFDSANDEANAVAAWLTECVTERASPSEIGVFVRSTTEIPRAKRSLDSAGIPYRVLDERIEIVSGFASVATMHLAKGLEFKIVAVMACDDEVIPLQSRIEAVTDDADLEEVYNTERHLLYVACTRARDHLMVSGVEPVSEFLGDLNT